MGANDVLYDQPQNEYEVITKTTAHSQPYRCRIDSCSLAPCRGSGADRLSRHLQRRRDSPVGKQRPRKIPESRSLRFPPKKSQWPHKPQANILGLTVARHALRPSMAARTQSTGPAPAAASSSPPPARASGSLFPPIPAPLQRLFDLVPLVTYPANVLPGDDGEAGSLPTLYVFISPEDAARGLASFNPTCLKWQVC